MILLFGGTSETAPLAEGLVAAGYEVLVSTATNIPLDVGTHPAVQRRAGPLDEAAAIRLIHEQSIQAVVDATHPYALQAHATAEQAARKCGIPYFRFARPTSLEKQEGLVLAKTHEEAAHIAFSYSKTVLLTTGSRNLEPYVREARVSGNALIVRVLPQSRGACRHAGIEEDSIVTGRGPFSVEENRRLIRERSIGVLVTKDSGAAGGMPEKLEAGRSEKCMIVVVQRPPQESPAMESIDELMAAISKKI